MKLYKQVWEQLEGELQSIKGKNLKVEKTDWESYEEPRLLLKSETAYELGGGEKEAVSTVAFFSVSDMEKDMMQKNASARELEEGEKVNETGFTGWEAEEMESGTGEDQIILYGPDLPEISEDCSYARFVKITLHDEAMQEGEDAYRLLRKIEYTRYHTHPKGFMMRISAGQGREPVRIGREELEAGMDFGKIGNVMLEQYHKHKEVASVTLIFVTDPRFSYENAKKIGEEMEKISSSMEEVFQKLSMDCGSCNLREICDTVEGMRELHFGLKGQKDIG